MIEFKRCYPDANSFNKIIKLKPVEEWKTEYVKLTDEIGYWIAESPFYEDGFEIFKNLVSSFPVQKDNNSEYTVDPNPFDTIHLPEWVYKDLCFLVKDFYLSKFNPAFVDPQIHEWGNVYFKSRARPISCWRIPHIDYHYGMVANMWFTNHDIKDSSTRLYKYHGDVHKDVYDFQIDKTHKMHEEWKSISENPTRADAWFNLENSELERWGFEFVGEAPTQENTVTLYKSNICHLAYVSSNVEFRWSHAFAFSHLNRSELYIKDIFRS
jgi:hypothetical protein